MPNFSHMIKGVIVTCKGKAAICKDILVSGTTLYAVCPECENVHVFKSTWTLWDFVGTYDTIEDALNKVDDYGGEL